MIWIKRFSADRTCVARRSGVEFAKPCPKRPPGYSEVDRSEDMKGRSPGPRVLPDRSLTRRQYLRLVTAWGGVAGLSGCGLAPLDHDFFQDEADEPIVRVASFNIRFLDLTPRAIDGPRGMAAWESRRQGVLAALRHIDADIVAFQEMETWSGAPQAGPPVQREWLQASMPGLDLAAHSGRDGRESGQPIFFRRSRFALHSDGATEIGQAGAFAGYSDLVTWARLQDRATGRALTVINLHLHFRDSARQLAGARVGRDLADEAMERGDDVVLLGDLNAGALSRPVLFLRSGALAHIPSEGASFHFNGGLHLYGAIDHIFCSPELDPVGAARILRGHHEGIYPSDHYPIWVDLEVE